MKDVEVKLKFSSFGECAPDKDQVVLVMSHSDCFGFPSVFIATGCQAVPRGKGFQLNPPGEDRHVYHVGPDNLWADAECLKDLSESVVAAIWSKHAF